MDKRFTNFPNIKANIDSLAERYDPDWDFSKEGPNFNFVDFELLGIISKLTHELCVLEQRVYELENRK